MDYWNKNVIRFAGFMRENLNSNAVINLVAQQLLLKTDDIVTPTLYVDVNTDNGTDASNNTQGNIPNKPG